MAEAQKNVYQFRVALKEIKPPIWRRIQVPEDYTFSELSRAIINAMGWYNTHLHDFRMKNPVTGAEEIIGSDPDDDDTVSTLDETETKIKDFFINNKSKAVFEYDFGDNWEHDVQLQNILPASPGKEYPVCITGKRACPPEDCGGTSGYMDLLKIWAKPKDQRTAEEKESLEWYEMSEFFEFDPEEFKPDDVDFESSDDDFPSNLASFLALLS